MKRALAICLSLSAAGCRLGEAVVPLPIAGPIPRVIAVWPWPVEPPHVPESRVAQLRPLLFTGLDLALQRRGYEIVTSAVASRLLAEPPFFDGDRVDLAALRTEVGADAVLTLVVYAFELPDGGGKAADWDLAWELTSTTDGALLWRVEHRGHWQQRVAVDVHPHPRDEMDRGPVLFGDRQPDFRDAGDLMAWLHRYAFERLPRAGG